jgi:hypothetical protein
VAKPKLEELRIRPGKNGHSVRHEFSATPKLTKGALSGGMMMDRPPAEEHNFGANEGGAMMKHIAEALALKGMAGQGEEPPGE